jgi:zinc D-Ala-D-Ala carboxypeptidase
MNYLERFFQAFEPGPAPVRPPALPAPGLYKHYSHCTDWPWQRWPNFTPKEVACRHCGELYIDIPSMDAIQRARDAIGPLRLNCGHRCIIHNAHVGGAPMSQHKRLAFDVSVRGRDRFAVYKALQQAGFGSFGFYVTFIHCDMRPGRQWFSGVETRKLWTH